MSWAASAMCCWAPAWQRSQSRPRGEFFGLQPLAANDPGGVTVEAAAALPERQLAAHGFSEIRRGDLPIAGRDGERVVAREVGHQALVEMAILLEDPGLGVLAEEPMDGQGEGIDAVGDGVGALAFPGLDAIGVLAQLRGEVGVSGKLRVDALRLHGVTHGSGGVVGGDAGVL